MKSRKILGLLATVVVLFILLVGCTSSAPTSTTPAPAAPTTPKTTTTTTPTPVFKLTFGHDHAIESLDHKVILTSWAKWVEKASGGRITIEIIPACIAAPPGGLLDAAKNGIVDMADQGFAFISGRYPLYEISQLPFLVGPGTSRSGTLTIQALYEKYPEFQTVGADVKVLDFRTSAANQINTVRKPIHTLEDMKGLLIVEFGNYGAATAKALGAVPVTLSLPEIYDGMAKGVAEGIDSNLVGHIQNTKTSELCDYTTWASTNMACWVHVMNLNTWNKLPPDLQQLFIGDNAKRLENVYAYEVDLTTEKLKDTLNKQLLAKGKEGIYTLPDTEKARWINAVEPVVTAWVNKVAPLVGGEAKARAILDDTRKLANNQYTDAIRQQCEATLHEWGALGH